MRKLPFSTGWLASLRRKKDSLLTASPIGGGQEKEEQNHLSLDGWLESLPGPHKINFCLPLQNAGC